MSLDVCLNVKTLVVPRSFTTGERIFVRRDGATVEVSREEWDEKHPDVEPVVLLDTAADDTEVYTANITHNLGKMAGEAGLYEVLWRPDEHGYEQAGQLIVALRAGLGRLKSARAHYEQFNPENGWGNYEGFVSFVEGYLAACEEYPDADVSVWR